MEVNRPVEVFWIYLMCIAFQAADARKVARCNTPTIPNGRLSCTTQESAKKYIDATHCKITCNKGYAYLSGPTAIDCYRGIWLLAGEDHVRYTSPPECRRVFINDGRSSFSRSRKQHHNGMCSTIHCEKRYSGITERVCRGLRCCWDAKKKDCYGFLEQQCQIEIPKRSTCAGTWYGIPKSVCESKGCCFDENRNTCYAGMPGKISDTSTNPTPLKPQPRKVSSCDELESNLANGRLDCKRTANVIQCSARCNDRYVLEGVHTRSCHISSEEWSPGSWLCRREFCNKIRHSRKTFVDCTNGMHIGSVCRASCARGYTLLSANSATCDANGEWTTPTDWECTEIQCPELKLDDIISVKKRHFDDADTSVFCTKGNKYGSVCAVSCPLGYMQTGATSKRCGLSAKWSSGTVSCVPLSCPLPYVSEFVEYSCTDEHKVESECKFSCPAGYIQEGPSTIRCRANQRWSSNPAQIKCIVSRECDNPLLPENATIECTDGTNVGTLCYVKCPPGQTLRGNEINVLACMDSLTWQDSFEKESCEGPPRCGDMRQEFPGADWSKLTTVCTGENRLGSVCTVDCGENGEGSAVTVCVDTVEGVPAWNKPPPVNCIDLKTKECDLHIDLSSGEITERDGTQKFVAVTTPPKLPVWRRWMSGNTQCEYQSVLKIRYGNLSAFALRMNYGVPSSLHFELKAEQQDRSTAESMKGKNFRLNGIQNFSGKGVFPSKADLLFTLKKHNRVVTYKTGSATERQVPLDFSTAENLFIGLNRAVHVEHDYDIRNMGSGMCEFCVVYAPVQ